MTPKRMNLNFLGGKQFYKGNKLPVQLWREKESLPELHVFILQFGTLELGVDLVGVVGERGGCSSLRCGAFARALCGGLEGPPQFPDVGEVLDGVVDVLFGGAFTHVVTHSPAECAADLSDLTEDSEEALVCVGLRVQLFYGELKGVLAAGQPVLVGLH